MPPLTSIPSGGQHGNRKLWLVIGLAAAAIIALSAWYVATLAPGADRGSTPPPPPQPGSAEAAALIEAELGTLDIGDLDQDILDLDSEF